jgi:beta-lactam-binding protein with PASTA domain
MDIEEFTKGVQPRKKRSKLLPYRGQIELLKSQGYTYPQIRDWLALNNIKVSSQMVQKFATQQVKNNFFSANKEENTKLSLTAQVKTSVSETETQPKLPVTQADKIRAKLDEQKRDAESKHFKHDKTGNI